jgi:hypothetical protein
MNVKEKSTRSRWKHHDRKYTRQREEHGRKLHREGTLGRQRQMVRPG